MANNNQQFLIAQMTAKGKRLTSGLEKWISEVEDGSCPKTYAYYYALGCLGGVYVNKKLIATGYLPQVVDELVANKLMKAEKAEKLKLEWENTYTAPHKVDSQEQTSVAAIEAAPISDEEVKEPVEKVKEEDTETSDSDSESHDENEHIDTTFHEDDLPPVEAIESADEDKSVPASETTSEGVECAVTRISFVYDSKTRVADPAGGVPAPMMGLFYDIVDTISATGRVPQKIEYKGKTWAWKVCGSLAENGKSRHYYRLVSETEDDFVRG